MLIAQNLDRGRHVDGRRALSNDMYRTEQRTHTRTTDTLLIMAKSRKRNPPPSEIPVSSKPPLVNMSEDEQWRIINESGVLKNIPQSGETPPTDEEREEAIPLGEEIFSAVTMIIPMSCLLMMMEILMHYQYGRQPTMRDIADRMIPSVPILSIFIFYTSRYKHYRLMQSAFFVLSMAIGTRLIYLINRANWKVNMKQGPPLATMWVYIIVQLDLAPATLSLVVVGMWVWAKDMKLVF